MGDRVAARVPYFQQLKDAGIPVLFRPQHEMNEGWAWWGGRPGPNGDARLFQITHDYLESKGLTNIIWVWALKDTAGGASQAASYYPGDSYVDVVALDVWVQKFPATDWYQALQTIAGSKAVQLYDCNGTAAQQWTASSGRLVNTGSGRCLDATGQSSADGTRLQIWDCTGNANQSWTVPA